MPDQTAAAALYLFRARLALKHAADALSPGAFRSVVEQLGRQLDDIIAEQPVFLTPCD